VYAFDGPMKPSEVRAVAALLRRPNVGLPFSKIIQVCGVAYLFLAVAAFLESSPRGALQWVVLGSIFYVGATSVRLINQTRLLRTLREADARGTIGEEGIQVVSGDKTMLYPWAGLNSVSSTRDAALVMFTWQFGVPLTRSMFTNPHDFDAALTFIERSVRPNVFMKV
jgi:hypothetical protein